MNSLSKFATPFFVASVALFSFAAEAKCKGSAPAHNGFCSGKDENLCGVHSGVCSWEDETPKVQVIINNGPKSCVAQEGKEAHESFCTNHDRAACKVHSSMCIWE